MTVLGRPSDGQVVRVTVVDGLVASHGAAALVGELVEALVEHHPLASVRVLTQHPDALADSVGGLPRVRVDDGAEQGDWHVWAGKQLKDQQCVWLLGQVCTEKVVKAVPRTTLLHVMPCDEPERDPRFLPGQASWLKGVAGRATMVWFPDEQTRSIAESVAPTLCERTRVFAPRLPQPVLASDAAQVRLVQPVAALTTGTADLLGAAADDILCSLEPVDMVLVGTPEQHAARARTMKQMPVLPWKAQQPAGDGVLSFALVDDGRRDGVVPELAAAAAWRAGAVAVPLSAMDPALLVRALRGEATQELAGLAMTSVLREPAPSLRELLPPFLPPSQDGTRGRTRVVLAGSDLKFAAPLVSAFTRSSAMELLIDPVKPPHGSEELSARLAEWADVVVCEFMTQHAVWYSQNLPPGKRLVVHLHGFELWAPLTDEVDIDRVDIVVVVSEFYKRTVMEHRGWPEEKIQVIPNAVSRTDLVRPKDPDVRFQLALVGWVPSLKRVDRALDLLAELLTHDDRYFLTIRGALPWNYPWEWQKPTHQDTYFEVLERLRESPELAAHVNFVPFGADVGNWLRSVGWMLSTSVRETFHLAPVEGMVSGAVPLVWAREGAEEVFSDQFVVRDHHEAASRILQANANEGGYEALQQAARELALGRYEQQGVEARWLQLVEGFTGPRKGRSDTFDDQPLFIQQSVACTQRGDFDDALDILDRNIAATSGAHGFTKQHEMFVRGVQELRFRLLRDGITSPQRPATDLSSAFMLVQVPEPERPVPGDDWGATQVVLVAPAPGEPAAHAYDPQQFKRYSPSIPTLGVDPSWLLRFDRYVDVVATQMLLQAQASGCRDIVVDGPLWHVLAAVRVARVLGGEVWWDLTRAEPADLAWLRESPGLLTDDPAQAASAFVAGSVAGVVVDPETVPSALMTLLPPDRLVTRSDLQRGAEGASPVPAEPDRRAVPLVVAAVVDDAVAKALESRADVQLRRIAVADIAALGAETDVLLLDTDEFLGKIQTRRVMDMLDASRRCGVRSVIIESDGIMPFNSLSGYYAKADVFAARSEDSLARQATRSVQAVSQLFTFPAEDPQLAMRQLEQVLGLEVQQTQAGAAVVSAPQPVEEAPAGGLAEPLNDSVSVVIPAGRADGSVLRALESVVGQTLPSGRIEVVVVTNGPGAAVASQVAEFAGAHPGFRWVLSSSEPGAARARNRALELATGDYVTFLDDDDAWERNHLASMMAVAAPDRMVVNEMLDLDEQGTVTRNTAGRRRLLHLGADIFPARSQPGQFSTMGGRLVPRQLLAGHRFDESLTSGEDIAFLVCLLASDQLQVTGAYELPERAYLRLKSANSVSRPEAESIQWGIRDRLGVLREIWLAARGPKSPHDEHDYTIRATLADPQVMFMERHLAACPQDRPDACHALSVLEPDFLDFLAEAADERAPRMTELVADARRCIEEDDDE